MTFFRSRRAVATGLTVALATMAPWLPCAAQDGPALIVLVRHAEKAAVPGNDPPLSEAGVARAKALAAAMTDANITSIVTSTFKRTVETGQALATARNIKSEAVGMEGGSATHVAAVAAAVRKHVGEVVLVIGHSNTIPAIIAALGGPKMPDICDPAYANLFVLSPGKPGTPPKLLRTRYGAADAENADQCGNMNPK